MYERNFENCLDYYYEYNFFVFIHSIYSFFHSNEFWTYDLHNPPRYFINMCPIRDIFPKFVRLDFSEKSQSIKFVKQRCEKTCIIKKLGGGLNKEPIIGLKLLRANWKLVTKNNTNFYWQQVHMLLYYSQHLYFTFSS